MKVRILAIGAVLLVFFSAANSWAQDGDGPLISEEFPNALGFSFGTDITPASIFNLHYHRWLGDFGFEVSLGAMKDFYGDGTWGADGIATLQYKFSDGNLVGDGIIYGALYGFLQAGYVGQVALNDDPSTEAVETRFYQYIPIGVGVGFEPVFLKHISLPIEVGFEYRVLTNDFGPSFCGSIRYRF